MKRTLLFATQTAHPTGGLETWLHEIVPYLEQNGWNVVVALARGRRFHDPDRYRAMHPHFQTVEVDGLAGTREARVADLRRVMRQTRADLVVPVNIADALEAVALEKLRRGAPRLAVMLRAQEPHGELDDIRRFGSFIDVAVGGNRVLRELLARYGGIEESRLEYIPPGSRRRTDASARVVNVSAPLRLAYVGRIDGKAKRVMELVEVADALDRAAINYELVIAGDGPDRPSLQHALSGRATFLGNVPVEVLYRDVYPRVDVLLLFSAWEAGPQVVWQAMHYGVVPVVSRYLGATAEGVLRDRDTAMVFEVGDSQAAAGLVSLLSSDRALLQRIASAAERAVDPRYLLDHSFAEWHRVFQKAMEVPLAVGRELPHLPPSGVYESLRVPSAISYLLRRLTGRLPVASGAGAEWPHHHGITADRVREIDLLAREMDR